MNLEKTPFDVEKAIAGKPIVTRDDQPVLFAGFNPDALNGDQVAGWVGGQLRSWHKTGALIVGINDSLDLFMAPKPTVKKGGWVNIYRRKPEHEELVSFCSSVYKTREFAIAGGQKLSAMSDDCIPVACTYIEWEEDRP